MYEKNQKEIRANIEILVSNDKQTKLSTNISRYTPKSRIYFDLTKITLFHF